GADDAVAPRLLVRLAQEIDAERLRRLHRPELRAVERRLHPLGTHPLDRLRDRQRADRRALLDGGAHGGVDEAPRDQRADRVVHHDDLHVLGRGLQRKPHRVLARAPAGVCNTLVTTTSSAWPMERLPCSMTTIVPSSRYATP